MTRDVLAPSLDVHSERIDDIPLLLRMLLTMGVPTQIDRAYTPHSNWEGLSVGWVATLWLVYILTECDHRMSHVRAWVNARRHALSELIGQEIRETDFTDDRLAEVLGYLSGTAIWHQVEAGISQQCIRVYDLTLGPIRLDATVGQVYHDTEEHTLFQVGRTKVGTYATQFKLMLGALDPMGLPVAVDVVSGERADDPLYVPTYQRIRQTLGQRGLLYVGDAKMGAIETRATIQAGEDTYLVPLAMVGETPEVLNSLLERLDVGVVAATRIYLPEDLPADPEEAPDPTLAIAQGFEITIPRTAPVNGKTVTWTERVFCVQSFAYTEAERKGLAHRLEQAETALWALTPLPGRGKQQYKEALPLQTAIDQILTRYRVQGLLEVTWECQETQRQIRAYGQHPARTETYVRYQVAVTRNEEAISRTERGLGWRLYASNATVEKLSLSQAVLTYREQYIAERDFARLHGRHLGMTPLYVQRDDHARGLIRLLTLALRAMVMMEFVARRELAAHNAKLSGIYAGQPQRATEHPTAEGLLAAFKEITLTTLDLPDGSCIQHMTPLTPVQETILGLLGMSATVYTDLLTGPKGGGHMRYVNTEPTSEYPRPSIQKVRYLSGVWLRTYTSILNRSIGSTLPVRTCTTQGGVRLGVAT